MPIEISSDTELLQSLKASSKQAPKARHIEPAHLHSGFLVKKVRNSQPLGSSSSTVAVTL